MSDSLQPHGLYSPWNSPGQNTGVGSLFLLQGIVPTQVLNPGCSHCWQILYQLNHQGSPRMLEWVAYPFSRGSSQPRNRTSVSCIEGRFFNSWATRELEAATSLDCLHPGNEFFLEMVFEQLIFSSHFSLAYLDVLIYLLIDYWKHMEVSVQFSRSVMSDSLWPMNCSMPGLLVHHQLPEFTQTHVHRVGDAIQPSHPLSSPSPPAPNPSQHQSLFQWVNP